MTQIRTMTLGEFLQEETRRRDMSVRQFGESIGVDHSTLSKLMRFENPSVPALDTLVKISKGTGVSLITLLKLAFPDLDGIEVDERSRILAERIAQLPADKREIAEAFILGTLFKPRDE